MYRTVKGLVVSWTGRCYHRHGIRGARPHNAHFCEKSAPPTFLLRPAPPPESIFFSAPRPQRPSAPANPGGLEAGLWRLFGIPRRFGDLWHSMTPTSFYSRFGSLPQPPASRGRAVGADGVVEDGEDAPRDAQLGTKSPQVPKIFPRSRPHAPTIFLVNELFT
jgi:hypothetical protein